MSTAFYYSVLALACLTALHDALAVSESFTSTQNCSRPVCPDGVVEITCTHTNTALGLTVWRGTLAGGGGECIGAVSHSFTAPGSCGENNVVLFSITNLTASPECLSSTARVFNPASLEGFLVECFDSTSLVQDNLIGSCTISLVDPPTTPTVSVSEGDIQETSSSTWSITLSWDSGGNDGSVVYTVSSNLLAAVNTTNTELTVPVELGMSYTFTVVASDECGRTSAPSEMLTLNVNVPDVPSGNLIGRLVFNRSTLSFSLALEWPAVSPTSDIAVRGSDVLIDGSILHYAISVPNTGPMTVPVNCNATTCSSPVLQGVLSAGVSELTVSVTAANALGEGEPRQGNCFNYNVEKIANGSMDITLTCPVEPCSITYRGSSQNVDMVGTSGEPLENLMTGEQYIYSVMFSCGNFDVRAEDSFSICECPSSALFGVAAVDEVTCPLPGFAGAVRLVQNSNGVVCYEGTTNSSEAVYICDDARATCIGNCVAICQCALSETTGRWSVTVQQQGACVIPTVTILPTGLGTGAVVGIVIGCITAVLLIVVTVVLITLWIVRASSKSKAYSIDNEPPPDPLPVYEEVGLPERLQAKANIAYGEVTKGTAESVQVEANTAYEPATQAPAAAENIELKDNTAYGTGKQAIPTEGIQVEANAAYEPATQGPAENIELKDNSAYIVPVVQ